MAETIESYGWFVTKVMGDEFGPGFAYSIGLFTTFGHPEVIMVGLKLDSMHYIINGIGENIRNGKNYESGAFYPDVISDYDCYFTAVDKQYYHDYVGAAIGFYRSEDFPLLQCIYPAKNNTFPWQAECPEAIVKLQPLLITKATNLK